MSGQHPEAAATTVSVADWSPVATRASHGRLQVAMRSRLEGRHRMLDGNALRAAVLGANDGLVSNFSLVMGVAGATSAAGPVLIAGVAGLLAGSLSMALGEWLSVQSSRELYANEIAILATAFTTSPNEEEDRLLEIYAAKGLEPGEARRVARRIVNGDPAVALDTLAREELAIDPGQLGGSAWTAAVTSFVLFGLGAAIPLIPFIVASETWAIVLSAVMSGVALFGLGAAITVFTGRHPLWAGLRQLAFGFAAAVITYAIGWVLGTAIL